MKDFYIVIDQDDNRELVYKPTQYSIVLEGMAAMHPVPKWIFEREGYRITVYPIALFHMPVGEDREEIEHRILKALNLI